MTTPPHFLDGHDPATSDLVAAARAGDEAAWAAINRRYYALMRLAVHRRIPQHARGRFDTEDVMQSGFLEAFQEIERFEDRGRDSFRSWLTTLMINKLKDKVRFHSSQRRDSQRDAVPLDDGRESTGAPGADSPSVLVETAERAAAILAAMHALDPSDQRLIVLRAFDKLPFAEIAARMEIGETTARRRFLEAFESLVASVD